MDKSPAEHTALRGFCRFLSHSPVKKGVQKRPQAFLNPQF